MTSIERTVLLTAIGVVLNSIGIILTLVLIWVTR